VDAAADAAALDAPTARRRQVTDRLCVLRISMSAAPNSHLAFTPMEPTSPSLRAVAEDPTALGTPRRMYDADDVDRVIRALTDDLASVRAERDRAIERADQERRKAVATTREAARFIKLVVESRGLAPVAARPAPPAPRIVTPAPLNSEVHWAERVADTEDPFLRALRGSLESDEPLGPRDDNDEPAIDLRPHPFWATSPRVYRKPVIRARSASMLGTALLGLAALVGLSPRTRL